MINPLLLTMFIMLTLYTNANAWYCNQVASERVGDRIFSCGIAEDFTENLARIKAFENAKIEFDKVCENSVDCRDMEYVIYPMRNECKSKGRIWLCYRGLEFKITNIARRPSSKTLISNQELEDLNQQIIVKEKELAVVKNKQQKIKKIEELDQKLKNSNSTDLVIANKNIFDLYFLDKKSISTKINFSSGLPTSECSELFSSDPIGLGFSIEANQSLKNDFKLALEYSYFRAEDQATSTKKDNLGISNVVTYESVMTGHELNVKLKKYYNNIYIAPVIGKGIFSASSTRKDYLPRDNEQKDDAIKDWKSASTKIGVEVGGEYKDKRSALTLNWAIDISKYSFSNGSTGNAVAKISCGFGVEF